MRRGGRFPSIGGSELTPSAPVSDRRRKGESDAPYRLPDVLHTGPTLPAPMAEICTADIVGDWYLIRTAYYLIDVSARLDRRCAVWFLIIYFRIDTGTSIFHHFVDYEKYNLCMLRPHPNLNFGECIKRVTFWAFFSPFCSFCDRRTKHTISVRSEPLRNMTMNTPLSGEISRKTLLFCFFSLNYLHKLPLATSIIPLAIFS